jgi:hypothetical protein
MASSRAANAMPLIMDDLQEIDLPRSLIFDRADNRSARLNAWSLAMGLASDTAQPRRIGRASRLVLRAGVGVVARVVETPWTGVST